MTERAPEKTVPAKSLTRRGVLGAGVGAAAAAALPQSLSARPLQAGDGWQPKFFEPSQGEMLRVLCDLILPKTSTPSASEAGVHEYIDEALSVADGDEQLEFLGGLAWLDARSRERFGGAFLELPEARQVAALEEISDERAPTDETRPGAAFFAQLKGRTLFGYYTSKTGRAALGLPETVRREKLKGC